MRPLVESLDLRSYIRRDLAPQHEGTFDLVIRNMLEHVDDPAAALREMHRALKPAGRAICQPPYSPRLTMTFENSQLQSGMTEFSFADRTTMSGCSGRTSSGISSTPGPSAGWLVPHAEILPDADPEQFGINERESFFDFVRG